MAVENAQALKDVSQGCYSDRCVEESNSTTTEPSCFRRFGSEDEVGLGGVMGYMQDL